MKNLDLKMAILGKFHSQADFADAVKTNESKVSQVIHGRRWLSPEEIKTWRKALGPGAEGCLLAARDG